MSSESRNPYLAEQHPQPEARPERILPRGTSSGPDLLMSSVSGCLHNLYLLSRLLFVMLEEARLQALDLERLDVEGSDEVHEIGLALDTTLRDLGETMHRLKAELDAHGISPSRPEAEARMKEAERDGWLRPYDPEAFYGGWHL